MKTKYTKCLATLVGVLAAGAAQAEELSTNPGILGGLGVNYVAKFVPSVTGGKGAAANAVIPSLSLKSDDTIQSPAKDPAETVTIARTKSMGWNDPAVNFRGACTASAPTTAAPLADPNTVNCIPDNGYGWGHSSQWYAVDLNTLWAQGVRYVHVSITVDRYDDGKAQEQSVDSAGKPVTNADGTPKYDPSDDDLIPALTVWAGEQWTGKHMHWYPQKYQNFAANKPADEKVFWADRLSPAAGHGGEPAWDTAWDTAKQNQAAVHIMVKLGTDPLKNKLTVTLAGDGRHTFPPGAAKQGQVDSSKKHDVNFKLTVAVDKLTAGQYASMSKPD